MIRYSLLIDSYTLLCYNLVMFRNIKKEIIYFDERSHTNDFLHLSMAGITLPDPSYLICHSEKTDTLWEHYNFEYVVSGKGYIKTRSKTYVVEEGDLFFLNKNRNHTYYSDKNAPYKKMFIAVEGSFVDTLIDFHNITSSVLIIHTDVKHIFEQIFALTEQTQEPSLSPKDYTELSCALTKLIQILAPPDFVSHTIKKNLGLAAILKNYIDDNIYEKLCLDDLSSFMKLTEAHIQRLFKEAYKITIMRYIREQKLRVAQHLLSTTLLNINEISEKLSFENPKHFSTQFRKQYGISPSQYAKQFKGELKAQCKSNLKEAKP